MIFLFFQTRHIHEEEVDVCFPPRGPQTPQEISPALIPPSPDLHFFRLRWIYFPRTRSSSNVNDAKRHQNFFAIFFCDVSLDAQVIMRNDDEIG